MIASLHLPATLPRTLTATELADLQVQHGPGGLHITEGMAALHRLLGFRIAPEVIGCGPQYLVIGLENAADYDLAKNAGATSATSKLTGIDFEDEPLVGPILIIEA